VKNSKYVFQAGGGCGLTE